MPDIDWRDTAVGLCGAFCLTVGFLVGNSRKRQSGVAHELPEEGRRMSMDEKSARNE